MRSTEVEKEILRRFHQIRWRINNQKSYRDRGIICEWKTLEEFRSWALDNGYFLGAVAHRPDRRGNYRPGNLEWISKDTHYKLSGQEKRVLSDDQVREIRQLGKEKISTRKIASEYGISQTLAWQVSTFRTYTDVA